MTDQTPHLSGDGDESEARRALVACCPGCDWNGEVELNERGAPTWVCPACGQAHMFLDHREADRGAARIEDVEWPFARWPWQRCRAVWSRNGISRRCDLRYAHHGIPHFSDQGLDPLPWWEGTVMPNVAHLLEQFWLEAPMPGGQHLTNEEVARQDGIQQAKWLADRGYEVVHITGIWREPT